ISSSAFFASSRAESSHTSRYARISLSFALICSKYAFVRSSTEYFLASKSFLACAIVSFETSILFPLARNDLLYDDATVLTFRRSFQKAFRIFPAFVWVLIGTHHIAKFRRRCFHVPCDI